MPNAIKSLVDKLKRFSRSSLTSVPESNPPHAGPTLLQRVAGSDYQSDEEEEWLQIDCYDVETAESHQLGPTSGSRYEGTGSDVEVKGSLGDVSSKDPAWNDSGRVIPKKDKATTIPEKGAAKLKLDKSLPPLPLDLDIHHRSPLRLVSGSGNFRTISSIVTPRPPFWQSRAASDMSFGVALEDLYDPDSPIQARAARRRAGGSSIPLAMGSMETLTDGIYVPGAPANNTDDTPSDEASLQDNRDEIDLYGRYRQKTRPLVGRVVSDTTLQSRNLSSTLIGSDSWSARPLVSPGTPRDRRLSVGPGLSSDDIEQNASVFASLAKRQRRRMSQ